ncbi:Nif3-like dinuclear metal center hexameric protein [Thermospira aquatica]|uniref:Nif3-like dinuclear metal center hexameric protein n=1 Tax=Thermospira aquatica TaxID=2828656 RepID=A0AAX3BB23_9SPIR|nr:Nif3-like dinuclear metal center hexameric protein [Thermospira aquatica]URA09285.1 Nif3-like dinuclear metal center hexameric protein [Thermospira aquatica]
MAHIREIEAFVADILQPWNFQDYCYNGIQIEGKPEPSFLAVGVSLNMAFLREAVKRKADMVLVHHGFFGKDFFTLRGFLRERVAYILEHNLTVMGYHLPLDAHPEYGNNACIARELGLSLVKRVDVGYITTYENPLPWEEFELRLRKVFPHSKFHIYKHRDTVQRVGIMTGGAASFLKSFEKEIDTFLCGEIKEQTLAESEEMGISFINAGHYYTETFGVKALASLLADRFGLAWEFIDIPNEV